MGGKQVYRSESQDCDYVGCREVCRYNIQVSLSHLALQWSSRILLLNRGENCVFKHLALRGICETFLYVFKASFLAVKD